MPFLRHRPSLRRMIPALALLLVLPLAAQEPVKRLNIAPVTAPPRIDGLVDDACWQAVEPVSGFFQYDPVNGAPASEETFVWAAYDKDNLYFAFLMKDSRPDRIWAELTPRNEFDNNDAISLIIDAYNDKRTSLTFTVNPRGVQKNSVETIWRSEAALRPDGWSAEMAIPFKSLRFSARGLEVWGIQFQRYHHRLKETDYWTAVDRDLPKLLQCGELCGLAGIRPGYNLEFFPYAGVRASRYEDETGVPVTDSKAAAGLDVKWGIRPNLYLDVTASPDFSEVESDPFIFQLSPYENYLQENRPFFTEGSRYFALSEGDFGGDDLSLFYSRRIRNPRFAAKVTGKTGGWGFGLLGALNKIEAGLPEDPRTSYFGVFRVQKDILENSQVGVYYAGVRDGETRNQNLALDFSFNFGDFYYVRGLAARTFNAGAEGGRNGVYMLGFEREPDAGLQLWSGFQRIEENVRIGTGYVDRIDVQSLDLAAGWAWRYDQGLLKRFSFDLGGEFQQDSRGNDTGSGVEAMVFTDFFNLIELNGRLEAGRSKYQVEDESDRLVWTDDFIDTFGAELEMDWERGGFLKEVSLEAGWEKRGIYPENEGQEFSTVVPGAQTRVGGQIVLRPRPFLEWSFEGDWIRQTEDATGAVVFDGLAYEAALHYQLTRNLFVNARLFGETVEKQYSLDLLIGYYFGAGNIVQLALKKSERSDILGQLGGYSATLKVSYLLRL